MGVQTDHSTMLKSSLLWDILLQFLRFARQARSHEGHLHMRRSRRRVCLVIRSGLGCVFLFCC